MYALIGAIIGLLIYHAVIKPMERKRIRKECIRDGLAPREDNDGNV